MYEIFNESYYTGSSGTYHWPEFDYIRKTYLKEIYTIEQYYHSRVYAVKSNHILQYILDDLSVPMQYEPHRYVEACRARAAFVSKTVGLTSEIGFGKIHQGPFYGPGSQEILLYTDTWFDVDAVLNNWQNVISVKPLLHCRSDLNLMLPNGKKSGTESGLSTISINIAMLALQYRQFSLDQYKRMTAKNGLLGSSHFIHMYVLPNMMGPHIDLVIANRLMNLYYGKPMGQGLMRHAFAISDYSQKVDRILNKVLERLKSTKLSDAEILGFIPSIFNSSMLKALQMPDYAPTRQIWWSLLLSRLDIMKFILDIGLLSTGYHLFMPDINQLKIDLYRLKRENILKNVLPFDLYYDYNDIIEEILAFAL
jgi:hypothetical protein